VSTASDASAKEEDECEVNGLVYARFVAALERETPDILARARAVLNEEDAEHDRREVEKRDGSRSLGIWDGLKKGDEGGGFSFGFGEGEEEMGDVPW
jgi:hypothetical protein